MANVAEKTTVKAADKPARKPVVAGSIAAVAANEASNAGNAWKETLAAVVPAANRIASDAASQADAAREQVETNVQNWMEKSMKTVSDVTEFAKGNLEALVESAKAAAKGAETLTSQFVEASKKSAEDAQAAFKAFSSVKSPNELIAAQNEFVKAQFDKAVANTSKATETWMKVAGDVVQPLSSRFAVAVESAKKSVAA